MVNDLVQELQENFTEYAAEVISDRALPDATTGLKPVARRILYGMSYTKRASNKPYVKNARIVGDVMGMFHPHGDSSIYEALVRLSQPWKMRYPLIDFHGNQGSLAGDGAAHMRYSEGRLNKLSEQGILAGINKNTVDFVPNYDETEQEPVTLPAIFPNLLCNPNTGIAVGFACNWAAHNLNEVSQAIFDYLDGKEPMLPGPDFPTGGIIINKNDIPQIMRTGKGSVKIQSRYEIKGNDIIFTEIPYGTTIEGLVQQLGEASKAGDVEGIKNIRDDSSEKVRIVVTCKKGENCEVIVRKIFAKTNFQSSFAYNQMAIIDQTPKMLNLKDCIEIYVNHNLECILREAQFDLAKAKKRAEIVDGLLKALANIDDIIELIRNSENSAAADEKLRSTYQFTENQAKAILAMRLSSLAHLEAIEYEKEKKELTEKIDYLNNIILFEDERTKVLKERLSEIVKKFGDARRTELAQIEIPKEEKKIETIVPEDMVIITTQTGYIKRIPKKSFRTQNRNGKGIKTKDESILSMIRTNTIDALMIFSDKGKMYRLIVDDVPQGTNATKGVSLHTLVKLDVDEKVIAVTSLHRDTQPQFVIFFTKNGLIKKSKLDEYTATKRTTGIQAIKLKDGDSIANISFQDKEDLILITKGGMGIKMKSDSIKPIGRVTAGVKGINLKDGDQVLVGLPIHKETDTLGIFGVDGCAKKMEFSELTMQNRGGRGVIIYPSQVAGAAMIDDNDSVLLVGPSSICISTKEIPLLGRIAAGNKMIKDGQVNSIVKL